MNNNLFADVISSSEIADYLELYQLTKLQEELHNKDRIIIVHQMGKVGSSSIYNGLVNLDNDTTVLHTHYLNSTVISTIIKVAKRKKQPILRHIIESITLSNIINKTNKKILTISLTREPISRNISAFFQSLNNYLPQGIKKYRRQEIDLNNLCRTFIKNFPHNHCLHWIDSEIPFLTGIDPYQLPFDRDRGYKIYPKRDNRSLLIMRLESLNHIGKRAISNFLKIDNFQLANSNVGKHKQYSDIYQEFKQNITLPKKLVDQLYQSKYTSHFYSQAEIASFSRKWLRN